MSPLDALPAQRLWDMSDEEFWAYARELAQGGSSVSARVGAGQYLECIVSGGTYLLPLSAVEEVLPSPAHYALLPSVPGWMPGLAAWRGEVIAVVDLEMYLDSHRNGSSGGLLLCLHYGDLAIGLSVPAVGETLSLDDEPGEQPVTRASVIDCDALLADVARQIGMAAHDA